MVITAGASQLSQQFQKLAKANEIEVIAVVRKDEHVKLLKEELGARYVLNQTSENFYTELKELVNQVKPTVQFEYIGGEVPAKIFELLPYNSLLVAVGNLSHQNVPLNTGNFIALNKSVSGFYLPRWLPTLTDEERLKYHELVSNDLRDGAKIFGSTTVKTLDLTQWQQALEESVSTATEGKILIKVE